MRYSFVALTTICSLLASSLACAQAASPANPDSSELERRFDNLRAIQSFGRSMDSATMRDSLFVPVPYDVMAYSKIPKKARSDFEKGNAAMKRGEFTKAREQFESAIAEYPDFALAHHNLGVAALNLKDVQGAREEFHAAMKSDPQMTAAYQSLGVLEIQEKNFSKALEPLQTANRLNPMDLKTLTLLAYCQALTQQLETAVLTAERVHSFKEHNGYAYAHMIAATALESLGRRDEAIREYKQFLAEDPSDPRAAAAKQQIQSLQAPTR